MSPTLARTLSLCNKTLKCVVRLPIIVCCITCNVLTLLYACITLHDVTKAQSDLLHTEESRPTRLPVIAEACQMRPLYSSLPQHLHQMHNIGHQITNAVLLQPQHAMFLRHRLQAS